MGIGIANLLSFQSELNTLSQILHQLKSPDPIATFSPEPEINTFRIRNINLEYQSSFNYNQLVSSLRNFGVSELNPRVTTVDYYYLSYEYPSYNGQYISGFSQIFVPETESELNLFVFGAGTTGLSQQCAASRENVDQSNIGNYLNHMAAQASQGQVVIFPDYDGFHDENQNHSYFVAEQEARSILGAIKALDLVELQLKNFPLLNFHQIVLSGYSQGGHAAIAAAAWLPELTPEYSLSGIIGYAAALDPLVLIQETPALAPYLIYTYQQFYPSTNLDLEDIFLSQWITSLPSNVLNNCVDKIYSVYPANADNLYQPNFIEDLYQNDLSTNSTLKQLLSKNYPLPSLQAPIILIQGSTDPIVTYLAQQKNLRQLCSRNNQVYYDDINGVDHFQIRQQSFIQTQEYLTALYADTFNYSSCQSN